MTDRAYCNPNRRCAAATTRGWAALSALTAALFCAPVQAWAGEERGASDEAALRALDRAWADAENRRDGAALEGILDDHYVEAFEAGRPRGKSAAIAAVVRRPVDPSEVQDFSDRTIVIVGDTGVIMETDTVRKVMGGRPTATTYRLTITYVRRGGRWWALAEEAVAIKP